jgi:HSP20 family protein
MTHVACRPNHRKTALDFQKNLDNAILHSKHQVSQYNSARSNFGLVNIHENENTHTVELAIPGYTKDDIKIELEQGKLAVSGHLDTDTASKYHLREFNNSTFKRTFQLPKEIKEDGIEANFVNGVLIISIPKAEKTQPKTIKVL